MIEVECDGLVATWSPESGFTGAPELVAAAEEAVRGGYLVEWGNLPEPMAASTETMAGALSALMYFRPGRTRITDWPVALREWWERNRWECSGAGYSEPDE